MATIIIKNSTGSGVIPSSLQQGELAINTKDGRLFYGSGSGNAVKEFTGSGSGGGGLSGGETNFIPLWSSTSTQTTSSLYQAAANQIILGNTASAHPGNEEALAIYQGVTTSYNLISGHSEVNSYSQLNIKNFSSESNASSDVVATADNGNESTGFIDMGINGSGYTATGAVGAANDAYLYSTGADLLIGNASNNQKLVLFNGGTDVAGNAKIYIHEQAVGGVISINTDTTGDIANPAALRILPPNNNTFNMIETEANLDGFVQSVFKNINAGPSASSDIVAHNDSGSTFSHFIDMGINSSTYNQGYVGGPNDTYIIGAGEHMHIGNIGYGPGADPSLYLYTGGTSDDYTRIYISGSGEVGINTLTPKAQLDVSGSVRFQNGLTVTGSVIASSFTGSLSGSATTALTASFLNTLNQNLTFNGNLTLNGTASINTLVVNQTQYSSGSNQLGDAANDTQTLYGSVIIPTGSLNITGSTIISSSASTQLQIGNNLLFISSSGNIGINSTGSDALLYIRNTGDVSGGNKTSIFEHRFGVNALSQTQRYGVIIRSTDQNMALGITNQTYNAMLQGYNYSTNAYGGVSLNPLGGSVSVGRNLSGTSDDVAKFVVRGSGATSATTAFRVENTNASASLVVRDDGSNLFVGSNGSSAGTWIDATGSMSIIRSTLGTTYGLRVYNGAGWSGHNAIQAIAYQYPIYGAQGSNGAEFASPLNTGAGVYGQGGVGVYGKGITPSGDTGSIGVMATSLFVQSAGNTALYNRSASAHIIGTSIFSGSVSVTGSVSISGSLLVGSALAPALNDTIRVTANIGVTTVYSISTGSYDGAFFDYVIRSGSNARAGQIMGLWSGSSVNFTETTTTDFGSTSNFTFGMSISAGNMILSSSTTSNGWTVKTIVRSI